MSLARGADSEWRRLHTRYRPGTKLVPAARFLRALVVRRAFPLAVYEGPRFPGRNLAGHYTADGVVRAAGGSGWPVCRRRPAWLVVLYRLGRLHRPARPGDGRLLLLLQGARVGGGAGARDRTRRAGKAVEGPGGPASRCHKGADAAPGEIVFADCIGSDGLSKQITAQTNFAAIWSGLMDPAEEDRFLDEWYDGGKLPPLKALFYHVVLETLMSKGRVDRALEIIRSYWGGMLDRERRPGGRRMIRQRRPVPCRALIKAIRQLI